MKLHEQAKLAKLRTAAARGEITRFRSYLNGPKFRGHHPQDGTPNDYINVREVLARLCELDDILDGVYDETLERIEQEADNWARAA
jgi:hypothetical protein